MTKEELEIDNKRLDFNEEFQLVVKKEEPKEQDIRLNKLCFDYQEKEKRIAELEDKLANADYQLEGRDIKIKELEHQLVHRNCLDCSNHSSNLRMRNLELEKENEQIKNSDTLCKLIGEQKRKIAELEKENAELKKQLGMSNKVYNDNLDYSHHIEGQLINAKEIIEGLMRFCRCFAQHHTEDIRYKEAEQFLNSEVEK